jgi:tetratricopeptide (TPR) repeat protein
LLLLLSGVGVAGWWYQQQAGAQQRRLDEAQQGIQPSLTEAGKLRAAGLKQVDNPSAWGSTLAAARTALEHARTLLTQEPDLAESALAQQVQQTESQLEADRSDWRLLSVFEQIRLEEQSQWDSMEQQFRRAESYPRLAQALADYGLAIGGLAAEEAAARVRQRSAAVQAQLRAVLEECLACGPKEQGAPRQWLAAVLAVDADPWLKQFRQVLAKQAWAEMEQLVAQAEVARYHPAVLVGLARNLGHQAPATELLLLRRTQQQYPGDFWVNYDLSFGLYRSHSPGGPIRPARAEELPVVNEAVAFGRVAVGLRPASAPAHNNLGITLEAQGELPRAIACYRKALDFDPKLVQAHTNLGNALYKQGDVEGAIACYRQALALDPKYAPTHYNLGTVLKAKGQVDEAIACYHKALALDPKYAPAHCNLGHALREQGQFAPALQSLKRGHQLGSQRPGWPYPSAQWVADCQRLLDLDIRLPALLKGENQPKDTTEQLALAVLCQRYKKCYAAAARFYADAFAAKPKLTPAQQAFIQYNATRAAALAAAGKGEDAAKLDAKEKTRLREQALAWLHDNLQLYAKHLEVADAKTHQAVQQALQHWQKDLDFDSVRDKEALANLPEAERAAWQQLWAEVEALRQKAAAANSP